MEIMHILDKLFSLLSPNLNLCASVYVYKCMEVEINPPPSESENELPADFSSNNFSWGSKKLVC